MNEHERDTGLGRNDPALAMERKRARRKGHVPSGLVVDLSGVMELDFTSLALLLTAQQHALKEDREIWLAGVPVEIWQGLHALGLGNFFRLFPVSARILA